MAIDQDVLVIGGGIAGVASALAAARSGADVRLVSASENTLRQASGLVDVLGYPPGGDGPVVDPFDAIADLPTGHPYERVGEDAVREGLALFDSVTGDAYRGDHTDRNALLPTFGGTVKPTARYPASAAAGLASDGGEMLLVGFESVTELDAPLAAQHLAAAGVPFEVRGVTLPFPVDFRDDAKVTRYAHAVGENERVAAEAGPGVSSEVGVRRAIADAVEPHLDGAERVGFPAILGYGRDEAAREGLADHLGVPVFEVPSGPPSLPGIRLEEVLYDALQDAGVRITEGNPVVDYETDGDRIATVQVERKGTQVPHEAGQFVLATGGLIGTGVESDREGVTEAVFDCHVPHPADRYDWFVDEAFGEHPFARFGVDVDRELRPRDADGNAEYENVRAAGAVLGGADYAAEKSASGISLATGHAAGTAAGENA